MREHKSAGGGEYETEPALYPTEDKRHRQAFVSTTGIPEYNLFFQWKRGDGDYWREYATVGLLASLHKEK